MSRDQDHDEELLHSVEQLVEYFAAGAKPAQQLRIGTEHEKFIFRGPGRVRQVFDGEGGIEHTLEQLTQFGWEPQRDAGRIVALVREGEAVSLEPGGQLELSGDVFQTIPQTEAEFDRHIDELRRVLGPDFVAVSLGCDPFDDVEDISWVPKSRYGVMKRYLATRGDLAHEMMKQTCTIQANMDYRSEADAVDLVTASVLASPLVNALFANSPIRAGRNTGFQSYRAHIWTRTDPDRTGVPEFMYRDDWGFEDYAQYVLDVPLFFVRRDGKYVDLSGHSFRELMTEGIDGHRASMGDFELHLSTIFPEVRLKRFMEVRSADGGPRTHVLALPALWKGIAYDSTARAAVRDIVGRVTPETHRELFTVAARAGIHGVWKDTPVVELCRSLISAASDGLERLATAAGHESEAHYLDPLREIVETQTSLADILLSDFETLCGDRVAVIATRDLLGA